MRAVPAGTGVPETARLGLIPPCGGAGPGSPPSGGFAVAGIASSWRRNGERRLSTRRPTRDRTAVRLCRGGQPGVLSDSRTAARAHLHAGCSQAGVHPPDGSVRRDGFSGRGLPASWRETPGAQLHRPPGIAFRTGRRPAKMRRIQGESIRVSRAECGRSLPGLRPLGRIRPPIGGGNGCVRAPGGRRLVGACRRGQRFIRTDAQRQGFTGSGLSTVPPLPGIRPSAAGAVRAVGGARTGPFAVPGDRPVAEFSN